MRIVQNGPVRPCAACALNDNDSSIALVIPKKCVWEPFISDVRIVVAVFRVNEVL